MRVGTGFDVHRLVDGRKLILGGLEIPFSKGLLGHSDADVLVHAIIDAMLGAVALGDIGTHFPDSDQRFKGADSMKLLENTISMVKRTGYQMVNLDSVIMAQKPRLSSYIDEMRARLATVFQSDIDQISVKATTTERLGFVGREEGIAAQAIVLLERAKEAIDKQD